MIETTIEWVNTYLNKKETLIIRSYEKITLDEIIEHFNSLGLTGYFKCLR